MFGRSRHAVVWLICCVWPLVISPAWSAPNATRIEPHAAQVLKQMTDYLKGLQQFSVQSDITDDVLLDSGIKIQGSRSATASVRRPDRLRIDSIGDVDARQFIYDGKTISAANLTKNVYAVVDAPPTIDAALNYAIKAYNLRAPLADLIYSNAYDDLTQGVLAGFYLGVSKVEGIPCDHLVFREKDIDWQIWIEKSPTPLPRKFLITDWKVKGLQFTALLSHWNTSPQLEDGSFRFVVPPQAKKIRLQPIAGTSGPK